MRVRVGIRSTIVIWISFSVWLYFISYLYFGSYSCPEIYLWKKIYLVNRLETNCRKSLIPFHAIWVLCIGKTSCLEVLFQCVLTTTFSRECKVWPTMIISRMKAMMMIPTAAEVVVRRLVLFVLFVLSKWRKVWPSKTNWLHVWLMWPICVLVCLLYFVVVVLKMFLSLSLFSNRRLEACN